MIVIYIITLVILFLSLLFGLIRILRGPTMADRIMATQLIGTTAVATLLIFAELQTLPSARDVALVLALLAMMLTVAFIAKVWGKSIKEKK
ncbi:monovalent cation/H+ antiporter complex subunit F [Pseudoalteromonas sp.]|uniref:monovalent cation/H+ antiporter complex subunit F n=1 Tax=Pseudoalteromonas sp. TaxID=53249 RepID=UPI001BD0C6A0|nr:monovalent cation/H+ antiporter complex subunit F [Pseudoalteromonas sp.]